MTLTAALAVLRRIPAEVWAGLMLLGALSVALWWAYDTGRDSRAAEVLHLKQEISTALDANATAMRTISQLQDANRELAEGRVADQRAAARAVATLRSERDALRRELDRRRADRGEIYERDSNAAAWARTGVPGLVADSLRR